MGLIGRLEFLLQTSKQIRYNLYLNVEGELYCISSNDKRQWAEKTHVFTGPCHSFEAELDENDQVHVVSCHADNKLYYHKLLDEQWHTHEIIQHQSTERILYPRIKLLKGSIHVFCDLHQGNKCTLYQYQLNRETNQWIRSTITTLQYTRFMNPFHILKQGDHKLLLLYTSLVMEHDQAFMMSYHKRTGKWSKPTQLTFAKDHKMYFDALLDSHGKLHITWSDFKDDTLMVQYSNVVSKESLVPQDTPTSLSDRLNCSFPQLAVLHNSLYCIWVQFNHLMASKSIDGGKSWSIPTTIQQSKLNHFKRYRYITNLEHENKYLNCNYLFGTLYPRIQFLGLGGENHDEIPTNEL